MVWVNIVLKMLGNLLYYWMYFELCCLFGIIGMLFGLDIVESIWMQCNEKLVMLVFFVCGIMQQMNVWMVGIIDDLIDFLEYYCQIVVDDSIDIEVVLSWCFDKVFKIELDGFVDYLRKLEVVVDVSIICFDDLCQVFICCFDYFVVCGCCVLDYGIEML